MADLYTGVPADLAAVQAALGLDDIESLTTYETFLLGRLETPASGPTNGSNTIVIRPLTRANGVLTKVEIFGGTSAGDIILRRYRLVGSDLVRVDPPMGTVTMAPNTLNTFDGLSWEFEVGEMIAIDTDADTFALSSVTVDAAGWYYGARNAATISIAGGPATNRPEVRLTTQQIQIARPLPDIVRSPDSTGVAAVVSEWRSEADVVRARLKFQSVDDQDPQAGAFEVVGSNTSGEFTTYQYGIALRGYGLFGHTIELQLASDDDLNLNPEFSVRHRIGGAGRGSRLQSRNGLDTVGFGVSLIDDNDAQIWLQDHATDVPATITQIHPKVTGRHRWSIGGEVRFEVTPEGLLLTEATAEPAAPAEGHSVIWQSNGTGAGDDGDMMVKITAGGVTKTITLIDFSLA